MEGVYAATIDRVVDGETAVLLLEADGEVIGQRDVPVSRMPEACSAGDVVSVTVTEGEIADIEPRPEEMAARRKRIDETFDRVSRRFGDDDEER